MLLHALLGLAFIGLIHAETQKPAGEMPVVRMEPFFVSGSQLHWRYGRLPNYEILSRYPDATTIEFLNALNSAQRLLDFLVPEEFQAQFDVPHIIILCDQEVMSPMYEDILRPSSSRDLWSGTALARGKRARAFPNVEVVDKDRTASLVASDGGPAAIGASLLGISHVRFLLDRRTPQLPPWLIAGIMNLYLDVYAANKTTSVVNGDYRERMHQRQEQSRGSVVLNDADYITADHSSSDTLQVHSDYVFRIPPFSSDISQSKKGDKPRNNLFGSSETERNRIMTDLVVQDQPKDAGELEEWTARATLFVRWAIDREYLPHDNAVTALLAKAVAAPETERYVVDGTNSPRREAFWKFVALASSGPVSEDLFERCLGLSFAEAADRLSDYLPLALKTPIDLRMGIPKTTASPMLRDANYFEIVRLKGEWERMALAVVRLEYRDYASSYIKEALMQAYDQGLRDLRFLALLGLLYCDVGDDTMAKGFLEAAVKANVIGPRVYYELSRISYNELQDDGGDALNETEIERIIAPLRANRSQSPPLLEAYELAGKAISSSKRKIGRLELDYLTSAHQLFPRELNLTYETAELALRSGFGTEAATLVDEGERLSLSPQDRARFAELRTRGR